MLSFALVRRRSWRLRAWLLAGAVLLALPNLFTLGIVLGTGSAAHAGERTLDVEGPYFRAATLAGAVLGVLAVVGVRSLWYSRRRHRQRERPPEARPLRTSARRFRKVFASYSHADTEVVEAVASAVQLLGDEYLIDSHDLRSGEDWQQRIGELIDDADVFQLFWSSNALQSHYVLAECRHALALRREGFIRPVYWQDPFPEDPRQDLPPPSDPPAPLLPPGRARRPLLRRPCSRRPPSPSPDAGSLAVLRRHHRRLGRARPGPRHRAGAGRRLATWGAVARGGDRGASASAAPPSGPEPRQREQQRSGDDAGRSHRQTDQRPADDRADRPRRCRTTRRSTAPSPTSAAWRWRRTRAAG